MTRKIGILFVVLILSAVSLVGAAQAQAQEIYTFDSGVQFAIPVGATLDDSGSVPLLTVEGSIVVEVIEPAKLGAVASPEQNATLDYILDLLLDNVGYTGKRTSMFNLTLDDGRKAVAFDFINNAKNYQSLLVMHLSDGSTGAFNIRSLNELTGAQRDILLAMAVSFNEGEAAASPVADAEARLMEGLTEEYAYDSGVSFRYPDTYTLESSDKPPVSISIGDEIFLTVVDPNVVHIPPGTPMEQVVTFAIKGTTLAADTFEDYDIGGREAVIGSAAAGTSGQLLHTMILVRFADENVGIMDVVTPGPFTQTQAAQVRGIAASFNSAGTTSALASHEDAAEAQALYAQADKAYKAKNYEQAIDLYTQALEKDASFGLAVFWRAAAYEHTGQLEEALAGFQQALELSPSEIQIHGDIAEVYTLLDEMHRAVDEIEAWIMDNGGQALSSDTMELYEITKLVAAGQYNRDFYFSRANQLRLYGRYEEALRDNQTSLGNEPNDPLLYAQRGVIYMDMKQPQNAIRAFSDGIAIEPMPVLFYDRGYAHQANFKNAPHALVDAVHDFQCLLLLADDSITDEQIKSAQHAIDVTMISDDSYRPITDAAECVK